MDVSCCKFIISAIGNVCAEENNKLRLGSLGAPALVLEALKQHMSDLDTAKAVGLTVRKLCEYSETSAGNLRDGPIVSIASRSDTPVVNELSSPPAPTETNRVTFFRLGVCEMMVDTLTKHLSDLALFQIMCRSIAIFCTGFSVMPLKLDCKWSAGRILLRDLLPTVATDVTEEGLNRSAASIPVYGLLDRDKFGTLRTCETVVEGMRLHGGCEQVC